MKPNIGTLDKAVRIGAALVIMILFFANVLSGTTAIILMVIAGVFIVTSFIGVCPIYLTLGISTKKKQNNGNE